MRSNTYLIVLTGLLIVILGLVMILDNMANYSEPVKSKWICTEESADGVAICTDPDLQFRVIHRHTEGEFTI